MAKRNSLVFIPAPGLGHLVPTIEFAHTLLGRDETISITILVINPFFSEAGNFTKKLSDSHQALKFIDIAKVDTSQLLSTPHPKSLEALYSAYIELHKPAVKEAVEKLVLPAASAGSMRFVTDMFCTSMIDVAKEFNSPCYTFFTSSSAFLGLLQFIATRPEFTETDPDWLIPSYAHPVPSSVLPSFVFRKDGHEAFSVHGRRIREMKGVIVNTFADLDKHSLSSFAGDESFPPLYPVGPLLDLAGASRISETKEAERERVLRWLDEQEEETVVFLCFGSMGSFKAEQLNEIAAGLENSGAKFLWAVRQPPQQGKKEPPAELEDPCEILPQGFLERTEGRGLICGWAPQIDILAHKSIGGFVTHCGWNSILESIWFGVPTVAWPLYAEQQINAFCMVRDLGLSVELKMDYRHHQQDLVSAAEVENAIKIVLSSDGCGLEMRKRVKEMRELSRSAVAEGGSSFETIGTLIKKMLDE